MKIFLKKEVCESYEQCIGPRFGYKTRAFGLGLKIKIISLFNLFLQLFMGSTALFDIIHELHCTMSTNFYLYLQYFQ